MKLYIFILVISFLQILVAQENKHLTGKTIDITYGSYVVDSTKIKNTKIFLDEIELSNDYVKKIGNKCINCQFHLHANSVLLIRSNFFYLINGELIKFGCRQNKLKVLSPINITVFEVYSKDEAYKKFGLKCKYGLIKIDYKK